MGHICYTHIPQDSGFISEDRVQRVWGPEVREYRAEIVSSGQDRCAQELAATEFARTRLKQDEDSRYPTIDGEGHMRSHPS